MLKRVLLVLYVLLVIEVVLYVYLTLAGVQNMYMLVAGIEMVIHLLVAMVIAKYYWRRKDFMKEGGM